MSRMRMSLEPRNERTIIEAVRPEVDCGRFPIKRVQGERVDIEADLFCDGHDLVAAVIRHRSATEGSWHEVPMTLVENDRFRGAFRVFELGRHSYTVAAWIDRFGTWRRDLVKRLDAEQDVSSDLEIGAELVERAAKRAKGEEGKRLRASAKRMREDAIGGTDAALDPELVLLMGTFAERKPRVTYERTLEIQVDAPNARFSTWYEMFPRSASNDPDRHGTFDDVIARLPYVEEMGFDVLYLPPIHPIGLTKRKGPNNDPAGAEGAPGSPWAIGSDEGGHDAIHPDLGTMEDFQRLLAAARERGIDVAIDLAFQCSPDHPWVQKHPEWFKHRPDGSIQYAENPPKKYEDIYPLDFESQDWRGLWDELRAVVRHWIEVGVRTFRVDNPHSKPFAFWEWLIGDIKQDHPEVIFLSEAFTRPKVMYRLAKLGFTQSYTYFTWRNRKWEIEQYFTELTQTEVADFFRPNLWPNTPDILTEQLQHGGRPLFVARLVLAATLGASYGIYGPAFELMEPRPLVAGKEEYLDSEKYQIRAWDLDRPDNLNLLIARVNRIRRENPALHGDRWLRFCHIDNDNVIAYIKTTEDGSNVILTVVNLDPYWTQGGWVGLPLEDLGIPADQPFEVHDLLTDARYTWNGHHNFLELNPHTLPAHIFRVERPASERDFEQFM